MKLNPSVCLCVLLGTLTYSPSVKAGPVDENNQPPAPPSFWNQDTMTGDWGGVRKKLEDDGFKVTPTYTALVIGNPSGGVRQGAVTDGLVNVELDFDLEKMTAGDVDGLVVHANALYLYGSSLSKANVGDFSGTTSINGYNTIRLQELWLEKSFFNQRLSIRVGNMAVDNEFFQSSSAALFVNNTFLILLFSMTTLSMRPFSPLPRQVSGSSFCLLWIPTSWRVFMAWTTVPTRRRRIRMERASLSQLAAAC